MGSQSKYWCFTLNNPDLTQDMSNGSQTWPLLDTIAEHDDVNFITCQLELGEQKTPHIQGYLELDARKRLTGVSKLFHPFKPHLEVRKGTQDDAIKYCNKDDTRVAGPWTLGVKSEEKAGKRNDLLTAINIMREEGMQAVVKTMPQVYVRNYRGLHKLLEMQLEQRPGNKAPDVVLMYGPPGCGKTRIFYDNAVDGCAISASAGFWFDGYYGQKEALLDDFDGRASKWSLLQTLQVLDRYVIKVPTKGGFVIWNPDKIFVTTNIHPRNWFEWDNREAQWPALIRRFTHVSAWRDNGTIVEMDRPDTYDNAQDMDEAKQTWDKFWNYPTHFLYSTGPYSYY